MKEFKPAIIFVIKFLTIYFVGNIVYGLYVESFQQVVDPITNWVTEQSVNILNVVGESTETYIDKENPKVHILHDNLAVISVFEGCNGINVIVIFIAFLVAFGGGAKKLLWFVPLGILSIHIANLIRIVLLYFVAHYFSDYLYFTHKFLFTGFIYVWVLLLWFVWATRLCK